MRGILRITSIILFILLAFAIKTIIQKQTKQKPIKNIMIIYLFIIVILSYFFHSYYEIDLTRLQQRLEFFSRLDFKTFIENVTTVTNYSEYTYFFVISRFNNPNLLQTITAFIFYTIVFYTIFDYYKNNNLSNTSISNLLFLFMLCGPFIGVISGIRTYLAISLIYLCIYREFIKNKNPLINTPLYFIAIGMHNAVLPIVVVRFCWLIFQKEKRIVNKIINLIISLSLFYLFIKNGTEIINYTYNRANLYLDNNIYTNIYGYIVAIINFVIMLLFYINFKNKIKHDYSLSKYLRFICLIIIVAFIFISQYSIFTRYIGACFIFYIPIFMYSFNFLKQTTNQSYKHNFYFIYYMLIILNIIIYYMFGDNSLINFFNIY